MGVAGLPSLERIKQTPHDRGELSRSTLAVIERCWHYEFAAVPRPSGDTMKTIQWNRKAVEQARAQGFDNPMNATCPGCGTKPALRQYGQYECECGELQGFVER
jgi:hypothetical protein